MGRGQPRKNNNSGSTGINIKKSDAYLAMNRARENVVQTSSGLQYEILSHGDGGFIDSKSAVTVEQKITLVDGKIISDTARSGKLESFLIKECIKGYREGLLYMSVGDRYRIVIPADLAWHKKGTAVIPASSVVIIEGSIVSVDN